MPASHWVKIDRALDHINALDSSIKAWRSDHPYAVREEDGPYIHEGTLMINMTRTSLRLRIAKPYPPEWSALIGDATHNLRSSLDHLAYALNSKGYADANEGAHLPPGDAQASEFPVIGNVNAKGNPANGLDLFLSPRIQRKFATVPVGARPIIEDVQPYKRGEKFVTDPLWLLHEFDRIDKHRQLVVAAAANSTINLRHIEIEGVWEWGLGKSGPLDDGDELAYWALAPGDPDAKAHHDLDFTFDVAFGKGMPAAGRPVVQTLRDLRDYVRFKVTFRLDKFC